MPDPIPQLRAGQFPTAPEWNLAVRTLFNFLSGSRGLTIDYSEPGKVTISYEPDADGSEVSADELWIEAENLPSGKQINHKPPPASGQAWKEFYVSSDGVNLDTLVKVDTRGHVYDVAGEQPPAVTNYRYCRCDTDEGDLIFATDEGAAIRVDDVCYVRQADTTAQDATDPVPTVDAVFDDCADCENNLCSYRYVDVRISNVPAGSHYTAGDYTLEGGSFAGAPRSAPFDYWWFSDGAGGGNLGLLLSFWGDRIGGGENDWGNRWVWGRYKMGEGCGYVGDCPTEDGDWFLPLLTPAGNIEILSWHN